MKKRIVLIICVVAALLIGGAVLTVALMNQSGDKGVVAAPIDWDNMSPEFEELLSRLNQTMPFLHTDFEDDSPWWLQEFPSDRVVGQIKSEEMARIRAMEIWLEMFDEQLVQSRTAYGIQVLYDELNDVWFLRGALPPASPGSVRLGASLFIFIRGSDGQVLAAWFG